MTHRLLILGGGTGGTLTANRLRRLYKADELTITVVDQDDRHVYQPGLLFVPFGLSHPEDIVRPRARQLHDGIAFVESTIDRVDIQANEVHLADGTVLEYDVLVVATGAVLVPEETEGLTGPGWMEKVFTFYTPEGAGALEGRSPPSTVDVWSSTSSTCRSSVRSRRWRCASSPTGTSPSAASATGSS
jgi:sulfide:quinone oxidoreductase